MPIDIKSVFVFAATGDQGRSVATTLVRGGYKVTGLTRNLNGAVAKDLAKAGVEMVKGDLDDPESYKSYLKSKDAVYLNADGVMTYYSNDLNAQAAFYEGELPQARNAAQACIDQGVKFIVYSVLLDYPGDKSVPHFDVKCQAHSPSVMKYIQDKGIPAAFINPCQYYSDTLKYDLLKKNPDRSFTLWQMMPDDTKIDSFAVEQTGDWVKAILEDPDKYQGQIIDVSAGKISGQEICDIMSNIYGVTVHPAHLSKEAFYSKETQDKVTKEIWLNYKCWVEGYFYRDAEASKRVNPGQWDFKTWAENSDALRKVLTG